MFPNRKSPLCYLHLFQHGSFVLEHSSAELQVDVVPGQVRLHFVLKQGTHHSLETILIMMITDHHYFLVVLGDDNDVDDHLIDVVVTGDDDDGAHKIVHLGEVLWSREFEGAGELHNLANVDPGILVSKRGRYHDGWFGNSWSTNLMLLR